MFNDPFEQFSAWMKIALEKNVTEPNAMVLSTVDNEYKPSSRVVLLRGYGSEGFRFFTNFDSRKGKELTENPFACLNFFWPQLERQVRIEGAVVRLSDSDADTYFQSRPRSSQIGAWSSPQSRKLKNRYDLEERVTYYETKFKDEITIPRPEFWGGFLLKPTLVEFWQGRASRLHDRVVFENPRGAKWKINRLAP